MAMNNGVWLVWGLLVFTGSGQIFPKEQFNTGVISLKRGEIFYWLFHPRDQNPSAPLIVWLNGGPGTSSALGLFLENGPFNLTSDGEVLRNPHSWNNHAYTLYIDQPVGVGFSTAKRYVVSEWQVGEDMLEFFGHFFELYPHLKNLSLFLTGESYAGHYLPAIGVHLARQNTTRLRGVMIGNGRMDIGVQAPHYSIFAYENNLISYPTYILTRISYWLCQQSLKIRALPYSILFCDFTDLMILGMPWAMRFNMYDIRLPCLKPFSCYDYSGLERFLNKPEVKQQLNATDRSFIIANVGVFAMMLVDDLFGVADECVELLERHKIPLLLYYGDKDFMCNWRGGEAFVNTLPWKRVKEWNDKQYLFNGTTHYKNVGNLWFYRVLDCGHMVPMDKPLVATDLLHHFLSLYA